MRELCFFFDYACPYAYLASTQIESLCARTHTELIWKPTLLGGIFRALDVPQQLFATLNPEKSRHNLLDMVRWADLWGVSFSMHPAHPVRTVEALRATLSVPENRMAETIHRFYQAYWVENRDIADRGVIQSVLDDVGVDGSALSGPFEQNIKDQLRKNTDEALEYGAFGVPAIVVDGELFWGQDRLWMVEEHLSGKHTDLPTSTRSDTVPEVDFYFDFSSPFSYLGSTQIERFCANRNAPLRWKPMLLGAVFKERGGPNIPMSTFSAPKQRFMGTDLQRWATHWDVPFSWPSRFPMLTVKPLRIALSLGDEMLPFVHACYRAYWADNLDISDPEELKKILVSVGQSEQRVEAGSDPHWKEALIQSTTQALDAGVFGAPTLVVDGHLFWGQDRIYMVDHMLAGWTPPT